MRVSPPGPEMPDHSSSSGDRPLHPLLRCLIYIVCWPAATAALLGLTALIKLPINDKDANLLVVVGCNCIAAVAIAVICRRFIDRQPLGTLGFSFRLRWLRLLGIGVLLGIGMQTLVLGLETVLGFAHAGSPHWPRTEFQSLAVVIPLLMLGAISEEVPFRGYLFQNLSEAWGPWPSLVVTSIVFASLHLLNPGAHADVAMTVAGIAAAGALFCVSVILTGSLWLALGCHFAWNLFEGPVFGFPVSGLSFGRSDVLTQTVAGPEWFTGGSFGPEAGASSLVALAAGAAVLYMLHRRGVFAR